MVAWVDTSGSSFAMRYAKDLYAWNAENPWEALADQHLRSIQKFQKPFLCSKEAWWAVCRTALLLSQGMAQSSDSRNIFFFLKKKTSRVISDHVLRSTSLGVPVLQTFEKLPPQVGGDSKAKA